jgi:hypothetical protein
MTKDDIIKAKKFLDEAPCPEDARFMYDPVTGRILPSEIDRKIMEAAGVQPNVAEGDEQDG